MGHWCLRVSAHPELLAGQVVQADFAADLSAVWRGRAPDEYQQADQFFDRTYLATGVRQVLRQVTRRLVAGLGDPTITLRSGFGGGKTHALLAVLHWVRGKAPLRVAAELSLEMELRRENSAAPTDAAAESAPLGRVAVIDGTALSPGTGRRVGRGVVRTIWGELASQLAGASRSRSTLRAADAAGTAPSKDALVELLASAAPCVVLIDELVAYLRQFPAGERLVGGTLESNLSFAQGLADAVKQVAQAALVVTLPRTTDEAGGERGAAALRALEAIFGRTQVEWQPVDASELGQVVRRRLFAAPSDESACRAACQRLWQSYVAAPDRFPLAAQQPDYLNRLLATYPLHPELLDRLADGWLTGSKAERARGLLRLVAPIVTASLRAHRPYEWFLLPGSVNLADRELREELLRGTSEAWRRVIQEEFEGDASTAARLDRQAPRLGQVDLVRRVSRALFLASASPNSADGQPYDSMGLDRRSLALNVAQPDESLALIGDALELLTEHCGALRIVGDGAAQTERFRLDGGMNLAREAERRRLEFRSLDVLLITRLRELLAESLGHRSSLFAHVELLPEEDEVPDDEALRLVVLAPCRFEQWQASDKAECAGGERIAWNSLRTARGKPRVFVNRVLALAPAAESLTSMRDALAELLAWESIAADMDADAIALGSGRETMARAGVERAAAVARRVVRDAYVWLMAPMRGAGGRVEPDWISLRVAGSWDHWSDELAREALTRELAIAEWGPQLVAGYLHANYWRTEPVELRSDELWRDAGRYLGLPRLRDAAVWRRAIERAVAEGWIAGTPHNNAWILRPAGTVKSPRRDTRNIDANSSDTSNATPAQVELRFAWTSGEASRAWRDFGTELLEPLGRQSDLRCEVEVRVRVSSAGPIDEASWRVLRENATALGGEVVESPPDAPSARSAPPPSRSIPE